MEDSQIIDLYWQRSERAIAESEKRYGRYCRAIAFNFCASHEDAEECVSDTWLSAWNAMPDERPRVLGAFFGTLARLDPVKDLQTMIRGFARAAERDPGIRLVIAGSGREERKLRSLIASLGMEDRISLPGWVEDTESFTAQLDAVLLTSLSETFPYALLSAARYSLPAAATRVGGVGELIVSGEGGFLLEPGDAEALCEAILTLSGDADLRWKMGAALHRRAAERFSLAAMAEKQREIYKSVLSGAAGQTIS